MKFALLFLTGAVSAATSNYTPNTGKIECLVKSTQKPVTAISDLDGETTWVCRLKEKITSTVSVVLSSNTLEFSKCSLDFTAEKTVQEVVVRTLISECKNEVSSMVKVHYNTALQGYTDEDWKIQRTCSKYATCSITGDPHITPFSGKRYDYQGTGTHLLVESKQGLRIVGNYFKCGTSVTCMDAISVQYGSGALLYNIAKLKDYSLNVEKHGNVKGIHLVDDKGAKKIVLDDGSSVVINVHKQRIDATILLSPRHAGLIKGQCGGFGSGYPTMDYSIKPSVEIQSWAASYKCPDAENPFKGNHPTVDYKPITPKDCKPYQPPSCSTYNPCNYIGGCPTTTLASTTTVATTTSKASTTTQVAPVVTTTTAVVTTSVAPVVTTTSKATTTLASTTTQVAPVVTTTTAVVTTSVPAYTTVPSTTTQVAPVPTTECPASFKKQAQEQCKGLIESMTGCEEVCPKEKEARIQSCIEDAVSLCNYEMCEGHRQSYASLCEVKTQILQKSDNDENVKVASQVRKDNGFGDNHIDCGVNGNSTSTGCVCKDGYSGSSCSVDLTKLPAYKHTVLYDSAGNQVNSTLTSNLLEVPATSSAFKFSAAFILLVVPLL